MAKPTYNDNQIEAANLLTQSLGKGGKEVDQATIDQIVEMLGNSEHRVHITGNAQHDTSKILKLSLQNETDWRKRAAISAMIISNNLDTQ